MLSQAVLDLINAAEADMAEAAAADMVVLESRSALDAASHKLDMDTSTAATLHTKSNHSALVAIAALKMELGIGDADPMPAIAGAFKANAMQRGLLGQAANLGLPWQQILQLLLSGGWTLLQQIILKIMSGQLPMPGGGGQTPAPMPGGMGRPVPTTPLTRG